MSRRRAVAVIAALASAGGFVLATRGAADRSAGTIETGVLRVESRTCDRLMLGSGFLVDPRHVVTAAHVLEGASTIALRRDDRVVAHGTIAGADRAHDVALIALDQPTNGHVFEFTNETPTTGERVNAYGYPRATGLTRSRGSVRGIATTLPSAWMARRSLLHTDAAVRHGESGGPMVAARDGRVVGMIDMSSTSGGDPSFAVAAADAAPLVARWRSDPEAVPQRPCRASTVAY